MAYIQADLSHSVSEKELQKFGKGLNFTDTAFTTAKDFSKLEGQMRRFAETVNTYQSEFSGLNIFQVVDKLYSGENIEKEDDMDPDRIVLDVVTKGQTNCSC